MASFLSSFGLSVLLFSSPFFFFLALDSISRICQLLWYYLQVRRGGSLIAAHFPLSSIYCCAKSSFKQPSHLGLIKLNRTAGST